MTGRKTTSVAPTEKPVFDDAQAKSDVALLPESANVSTLFVDAVDLGKQIGRMETAALFGNISDKIRLVAYEKAKESRSYIKIINPETGNHFQNIDEFCKAHLGRSARRLEQLLANRKTVGDEIYEQSEQLGLRQKDYNAINALPSDDKALIQEAIAETTSREEVINLLQEMAARHYKEKESLSQQNQDKDVVVQSKQRLIDHQADQLDELSAKARFVATCTPSEKLEGIRTELLQYATAIELNLVNQLAPAFAALKAHLAEHGGECDAYLSGSLGQIERAVREIRENFGLLRAEDVAPWANLD